MATQLKPLGWSTWTLVFVLVLLLVVLAVAYLAY